MIEIIDIIHHKNAYSTQEMIVTSRKPKYLFEKKGIWLIGEDSGFFSFLYYQRPCKGSVAFAGRKFDILMKDGSVINATGQYWDGVPESYSGLLRSIGRASIEELDRCYVFSSSMVDKEIVNNWLSNNEPSNNYNKYDKRSKDYMVHKIVSKF